MPDNHLALRNAGMLALNTIIDDCADFTLVDAIGDPTHSCHHLALGLRTIIGKTVSIATNDSSLDTDDEVIDAFTTEAAALIGAQAAVMSIIAANIGPRIKAILSKRGSVVLPAEGP
jgi:hypothetical protein